MGLAALGADEALGQQAGGLPVKPDVGALLPEQRRHMGDGLGGDDVGAAVVAVEDGDGHAPDTLAADAPVGALGDHAGHALLAPLGLPLDGVAGLHGRVLDGVHGAEPLLRGPVDDGVLAAPAVGVGVGDVLPGDQEALLLQILHHHVVALGVELAIVPLVGHDALGVHRHGHADVGEAGLVVLLADLEVLRAEAGGGVDAAGAGVQGDMLAVEDDALPVEEGVLGGHELKLAALEGGQYRAGRIVDVGGLADALGQVLGQDVHVPAGRLEEDIVERGVQADGIVAGDGPGGGGPDHEVELGEVGVPAQPALVVPDGELHKDGGAGVVGILDLGLGQGGLVVGTPVHRLHALVDKALLRHLAKDLDLLGLKLGQQGDIGVLPLAQHAQALELAGHLFDVALGVLPALGAELGGGHLLPLDLFVLEHRRLDGQAVGVPAGDIGGAPAGHVAVLDDDVLEDLVEGGADVDVAVGVGRAVMEDEGGLALVLLHQLVVEVVVVHLPEHVRLPLGQARPHGEVGLGQVNGLVVIHGLLLLLLSDLIGQFSPGRSARQQKTPLSPEFQETKAF